MHDADLNPTSGPRSPAMRVTLDRPALLQVGGDLVSCATVDLSVSGIGIRSARGAFDTDVTTVIVRLPGQERVTEVEGRLVRRECRGGETNWGIRFVATPPEVRDYVAANRDRRTAPAPRAEHTPELESLFQLALQNV